MYLEFKDASCLRFEADQHKEFLEEVVDNSKNEQWIDVPVNKIRFVTVADAAVTLEESTDFRCLEIYSDTCEHLPLYCRFEDEDGLEYFYPVGETAFRSICDRAGLSGPALLEVSNEDMVYFFNTVCARSAVEKKNGMVYISCDKVRAIHSEQYTNIDMGSIYKYAHRYLDANYEVVEFEGGYVDHKYFQASYTMDDDALLTNYAALLGINRDDLKANVMITSSNVALSGVNIDYGIQAKDLTMYLGMGDKMMHKGKNCTVEGFAAKLENIFGVYQAAYANLAALAKVTIYHPNSCLINVLHKHGFDKKLVTEFVAERKAQKGMSVATALDMYQDACRVIELAKSKGYSIEAQIRMMDYIAVMIRPGYLESYDYITSETEI